MFFVGPGVLLLCDSIGKYVKDIIGLEVKSFPGITSSQLAGQCETRRMKNMLKSKQCVIVHVGTNDVQKLDPGKICSNVSNICFNINEANSDIQIYFSSILPRNDVSKEIDKKISATYTEIEKVCKKKKFPFLHTYRPLRDKTTGEIHRHMFCVKRRGFALKS